MGSGITICIVTGLICITVLFCTIGISEQWKEFKIEETKCFYKNYDKILKLEKMSEEKENK